MKTVTDRVLTKGFVMAVPSPSGTKLHIINPHFIYSYTYCGLYLHQYQESSERPIKLTSEGMCKTCSKIYLKLN